MHPADRNAAVGGMIVVLIMWIGGYFAPGLFMSTPPGLEAGLTLGIVALLSWVTPEPGTRQPPQAPPPGSL